MAMGDRVVDDLDAIMRRARRETIIRDNELLNSVEFGRNEIEAIVPHRGVALLLDGITGVCPNVGILRAHRRLRPSDRGFKGHFPEAPIYPGVLQVEMIAQAALCLSQLVQHRSLFSDVEIRVQNIRLVRISQATFVSEARPGDLLTIDARHIGDSSLTVTAVGQVLVGERIVSAAAIEAINV
jgi:3-hydroxyacyl-[acyl-carrier-protein] dehydratase